MALQHAQQMTVGGRAMGFPTSEYGNDGWKLYITSLVMIICAGIIVTARCSTRFWLAKLGWDDVVIIASYCSSVIVSVTVQLAISHGYGMHKADLSKDDLHMALKFFFIAQAPCKITNCLNKVAMIMIYLRQFPSSRFRVAAFTTLGVVVLGSVGSICATIFQCVPVAGAWDESIEAKCIHFGHFWVANSVMNILTNVMMIALPIPMVQKLKLGKHDKAMLFGLFLLGGFVTITSILRTTSVQHPLKNRMDITFDFSTRGIWTLIEANLGTIIPCLVVLRQELVVVSPQSLRKARAAQPGRDDEKGFALSDLRAGQTGGLWRGTNLAQQSVFISGPGTQAGRRSDECCIFSNISRDSNSDDGKSPEITGGISKKVEVTRTSIHLQPGREFGFSSPLGNFII
ncbi:hypothetical protein BB8028_0003g10230 [Beauveria bassiana]|uniref:Rhodopsin domain-containing protein n=1 Tax=Beauveria bassiana TaxID=176275 RepID=A0A2S7Y8C2_BEABA|nr:hypothetical protein BB8028_0003g10230 [Beauveria bassiana]